MTELTEPIYIDLDCDYNRAALAARIAPMTCYMADLGYDWRELTWPQLWRQFWMAVSIADWNPRRWATNHDACYDLATAWWLAGHAIDYMDAEDLALLRRSS